MVEFFDTITKKNISFYIEARLLKNLDLIKNKIQKRDKDYVIIVDGNEGSGKSVFAMQIGKYVDPSLNLSRICMSAKEFKDAIIAAKQYQCVIYDEAFTGLSSRSSLSEINRMLVSLMMQMRQKNLFVIVVLPTFFMVDKYVALFRAQALIHIFESKERRYFQVFNRKKKKYIYLRGLKTYSYGKQARWTRFRGKFYGKYIVDEEKYRKKKSDALEAVEKELHMPKYLRQRNEILFLFKRETKFSLKKMEELLTERGVELKKAAIGKLLQKLPKTPDNRRNL